MSLPPELSALGWTTDPVEPAEDDFFGRFVAWLDGAYDEEMDAVFRVKPRYRVKAISQRWAA